MAKKRKPMHTPKPQQGNIEKLIHNTRGERPTVSSGGASHQYQIQRKRIRHIVNYVNKKRQAHLTVEEVIGPFLANPTMDDVLALINITKEQIENGLNPEEYIPTSSELEFFNFKQQFLGLDPRIDSFVLDILETIFSDLGVSIGDFMGLVSMAARVGITPPEFYGYEGQQWLIDSGQYFSRLVQYMFINDPIASEKISKQIDDIYNEYFESWEEDI